ARGPMTARRWVYFNSFSSRNERPTYACGWTNIFASVSKQPWFTSHEPVEGRAMKGDFSRDTFNRTKHYAAVLMQQGRVQLDADWNEQQSIARHRSETETSDVVGDSGAPLHNAGFLLTTPDGKAVTMGIGRYYAGGILCENESAVNYAHQPVLPNPPAIADLLQTSGASVAI